MTLLVLVAIASLIGLAVIALARRGAVSVSTERDRVMAGRQDEISTRLGRLDAERLEGIVRRVLDKIGLDPLSSEQVSDDAFDILARDERPLVGGVYLFHCIASGEETVDGPQVVGLGDTLRAVQANKAVLVSTGFFTDEAVRVAADYPIELIGRERLRELLFEQQLLILVELDG
ncbi:MAG: hypothetical protein CME06_02040 [Gemmatimonadetes bacterium]|nr:hypothetical protein [Gemmatimonadota bacterium]